MPDDTVDEIDEAWFQRKSELMEEALGREHELVWHAIIPYAVGGALDLYFYPHGVPGTGVATKELSPAPDEGSSNDVYATYELVMFTRHKIAPDAGGKTSPKAERVQNHISGILNPIARYSETAKLNPGDTCEFPRDFEDKAIAGKCLIFDGYTPYSEEMLIEFGLMAVIEIFASEMAFARQKGGDKLIKRLKDRGHYPYSDLNRDPVA